MSMRKAKRRLQSRRFVYKISVVWVGETGSDTPEADVFFLIGVRSYGEEK